MKKISIIIPVYNAEKYIGKCLYSIVKQGDDNIEVIIINDGSKDESYLICEKYACQYAYIKYVKIENAGVSNARNIGLSMALGEWVMFVDADDELEKDALRKIRSILDKHADLIYFNYRKSDEEIEFGNRVSELSYRDAIKASLDYFGNKEKMERYINVRHMYFSACWGKIYNRKVIEDNQLKFNINLRLSEDLCFNISYLLCCQKVIMCDIPIYIYRINMESVTHSFSLRHLENRIELIQYLQALKLDNEFNKEKEKYMLLCVLQCNGKICCIQEKKKAFRMYKDLIKDSKEQLLKLENNKYLSDGMFQKVYYMLIFILLKCGLTRTAVNIGALYDRVAKK